MLCQIFRVDLPTLISALTDSQTIARWQHAVSDELPSVADRPLLAHLKRLSGAATRVLTDGFETAARQDQAVTDALLTDLFAVATWHQWSLPIEDQGCQEVDVSSLPRGLIGADISNGAGIWVLDHQTIALARQRQAAAEADWSTHARA